MISDLLKTFRRLTIRARSRYQPFKTRYPGFLCAVPDKSSFLAMTDEIFGREIYRFTTPTNKIPYILDCGANIGLSVRYFKSRYPESEIIAFEPDPKIYEYLIKNTGGLANVRLVMSGLGKEEGATNFFSEGSDGGRIALETDPASVSVHIEHLSKYIDRRVDFLKIDIEGAEVNVIRECRDKLNLVQNMFVEWHGLYNKPQELGELLEIIRGAGFRYYLETVGVKSGHPFIERDQYLGYDMQANIFCYRK